MKRWLLVSAITALLAVTASCQASGSGSGSSNDTTPAFETLNPDAALVDVLFTYLSQDSLSEYAQVMATAVNTTIRRIAFERPGGAGSAVGLPFGQVTRVRVRIDPPTASEGEQRPSTAVRASLQNSIAAREPALVKIAVTGSEAVDSLDVYAYPVTTTWDLVYNAMIVAVGSSYVLFMAFVALRFYMASSRRRAEDLARLRELEALQDAAAAKAKEEARSRGEELKDDLGGALIDDVPRGLNLEAMDDEYADDPMVQQLADQLAAHARRKSVVIGGAVGRRSERMMSPGHPSSFDASVCVDSAAFGPMLTSGVFNSPEPQPPVPVREAAIGTVRDASSRFEPGSASGLHGAPAGVVPPPSLQRPSRLQKVLDELTLPPEATTYDGL